MHRCEHITCAPVPGLERLGIIEHHGSAHVVKNFEIRFGPR
jgi:hypothetical protein